MTRAVGRYIPYEELFERDHWPVSDPWFCLDQLDPAALIPSSAFFLSHRWLAFDHPDPDGHKLASLKTYYTELRNMREELSELQPERIDRKLQRRWLTRRRTVILM